MRFWAIAFVVLSALATGCGAHERGAAPPPLAQSPEARGAALPDPDARLPREPGRLAARLATTTRALDSAIATWLAARPTAVASPTPDVTLLALDQQRIYRLMRGEPRLGQKVLARLPARLRTSARDNVVAGRSLLRLMPRKPPRHVRVRTGPATPPGRLLVWYRQAERQFGVDRWVLAAVNFVESAFGRMRNASYAGARGPMQFMPATWTAYGLGGDIRDPRDAIRGAANYLRASGAPENYRRALYSYNNSPLYVDAVLRYARQMRRAPQRFYAYWSWQVYIRTPHGERRLTGPGRRY